MSTWFARRVLDLATRLAEAYYTHKYGALAHRLGRHGVGPDPRRGFIIVQIDGLSYDHLIQAVAAGAMPYLGRLLAERHLTLAPWRCGLPSTTPAAQAGFLHGTRFDIPGFRWFEKETGRAMNSKRPDQVQVMRARMGPDRAGILRGGSCYVSLFDGDADLALFTLSALQSRRFFESVRGMGLFLLFLLSPFRVLRLCRMILVNYLGGLGRRLVALARPSVLNPLDVFSPLIHAIAEVLFTEVQTFGVMLDIYRCVPAIYANYNAYDEVAHKVGPSSRAAFRILRDVDQRIRQINRMRARYQRRPYDLYLLSDHGNSPSVPFSWRNGATLGRYIADLVGQDVSVTEQDQVYTHSAEKARYLLDELQELGERLSPRLRWVLAAAWRYVDKRAVPEQGEGYDPGRQQDVVVSASGPLAHVYFNVCPRSLDLFEVMVLYPRLVDVLLGTPGVGALVGRAGEKTLVLGYEGGMAVVGDEGATVDHQPHPLASYGDVTYATAQVHRLAHFPHSGDLLVLGGMEPEGQIVTFEKQEATHGGLGGPQMRPFIAWPPGCPLAVETLDDAEDLYPYFVERYVAHGVRG